VAAILEVNEKQERVPTATTYQAIICIAHTIALLTAMNLQYFNTFCAAPESERKSPSYDTTKEVCIPLLPNSAYTN